MADPNTDYRSLYGKDYIGAWDLLGRDVTVTIARVLAGELRSTKPGAKPDRKPIVYFEGKSEKGFVLNATNGKTIAAMYGTKIKDWIGKRITLFATTTQVGSETKDCIRVRPKVPQGKGGASLPESAPAETRINESAHEVAPDPSPLDASDDGSVPGV